MQNLKSSKKLNRSLRFFFCFVVIVSLLFSCFAIPSQAVLTEAAIVGGVCLALAAAAGITLSATGNFTSSGLAEGVGSAFQSASEYVYDAADFVFHPSTSTLQAAVEVAPDVYNKFRTWISGLNFNSSPSNIVSSSYLSYGNTNIPCYVSSSVLDDELPFSYLSPFVFSSQQDLLLVDENGLGLSISTSGKATTVSWYNNGSLERLSYFSNDVVSYFFFNYVPTATSYLCYLCLIVADYLDFSWSQVNCTSSVKSHCLYSSDSLSGSVADTGPNLLDQIDDHTDPDTKVWVTDPVISDLVNPSLDSFLENLANRILTGSEDLSGVQAHEATAQPELVVEDEPVLPNTGWLPNLPAWLDNLSGLFSSIWAYVTRWVNSLTPFITKITTVWSILPAAMLYPVYATAVVVIVLGLLKRFIG